jgi:hypothetical protein
MSVLLCVVAVVGAVVWMIAYRVGFNEGRLTIPLRLIHALAEHKLGCLAENPDQVVRELMRVLALPEHESRRLVSSKLRSAPPVERRTLRSA